MNDASGVSIQLEAAGQHDVFATQLQVFQIRAGADQHRIAHLRGVNGGLNGGVIGGHPVRLGLALLRK